MQELTVRLPVRCDAKVNGRPDVTPQPAADPHFVSHLQVSVTKNKPEQETPSSTWQPDMAPISGPDTAVYQESSDAKCLPPPRYDTQQGLKESRHKQDGLEGEMGRQHFTYRCITQWHLIQNQVKGCCGCIYYRPNLPALLSVNTVSPTAVFRRKI